MSESSKSTITPLFNASLIHNRLDGYTEYNSDAALNVGAQENTYLSLGLGAEYSQEFGASILNRTATVAARAMVLTDLGDRSSEADVSFVNNEGKSVRIEGADPGCVGFEFSAGISVPVSDKGDSIFLNGSYEVRNNLNEASATFGYRFKF